MTNYTVLHLHSDMSNGVTNIDSVTKYIDYIKRAEELGMKAMAFSEHGSVFAWDLKKEEMEKHGLKYSMNHQKTQMTHLESFLKVKLDYQ